MKRYIIGSLVLLSSFLGSTTIWQVPLEVAFDANTAIEKMKNLQSSVDIITDKLYTLDAQEREREGWLSDNYRAIRSEIVSVVTSISRTTSDMQQLLKRIALYQVQIEKQSQEVKDLRASLWWTTQTIAQLSTLLYKASNELYDHDTNTINELKLFIRSDNVPRTLSNEQLIAQTLKKLDTLSVYMQDEEQKSLELIRKLTELRTEARNGIALYTDELEKLEQKRNYLAQFIDLYSNDRFREVAGTQAIYESRRSVQEAIDTMVKDIGRWTYTNEFNVSSALAELENMNNNKSEHPVAWPVYPIEDIEKFFGDSEFENEYNVSHDGLQVVVEQGTPVYAMRDWVVYHMVNNKEIWINWIMILHTQGYVTVYTYMSDSVVEVGDIVQRWQLIGFSGGEPGTHGAWFVSPGPNLTFSVYKDSIAVDPLRILDISVVRSKDILPSTYHIKFLRDVYARPIDITNLTFMSGSTVDQRSQRFLNTYAVWIYKNVNFWNDAVASTHIDRDMVICVAFAESTLGRYLSTDGNIGNVGNNDRWDRFAFGSALAGARAIAQTLNNQHLWHYHTINQLSRYGNEDGKIYASSPINWQTNVLKCLSQIKGYYVPEDFPFRTHLNPNSLPDTPRPTQGFDWEQVRVGQG